MGYYSDIRIVISQEGFNELKKYVDKYLADAQSDIELYNYLEKLDVKVDGKNQCYFGWDNRKWNERYNINVDAIMEGLNHLENIGYSYRYMRIGEDYDDIEEKYYDGNKDEEIDLDYPEMIRKFNDESMLQKDRYYINGEAVYEHEELSDGTICIISVTDIKTSELVIPSVINGLPIACVGSYALKGCTSLKKVTIPESVNKIEEGAFYGCYNLNKVIIKNKDIVIESGAFSGCPRVLKIEKQGSELKNKQKKHDEFNR